MPVPISIALASWVTVVPIWGMGPWMMGWGFPGMIFGFFFWVAIVLAIILLVRWLVTGAGPSSLRGHDAAIEVLRQRYARGEISKEEFEERMAALTRPRT